jgi:aerobic carbon-monoxide dehydrogenase medium subunit
VKTNAFAYHRATSVDDALRLHSVCGEDARYLAGGQSLMAALNFRLNEPSALIDISRIEALRGISTDGGRIRIGALARHAEVAAHQGLAAHVPLIPQAMGHVAHPAIRNRGTFGGSVALADPAAEMPACVLALEGVMEIAGSAGTRRVKADDFFLGTYETALEPGELLTAVEIPVPPAGSRHGFAELARRRGDYAMAGLCMMLGPAATSARVVFFGISDRPLRSRAAEAAISGGASPADAAAQATEGLDVFGDLNAAEATKRHYAAVLLRRELERLGGRKEPAA